MHDFGGFAAEVPLRPGSLLFSFPAPRPRTRPVNEIAQLEGFFFGTAWASGFDESGLIAACCPDSWRVAPINVTNLQHSTALTLRISQSPIVAQLHVAAKTRLSARAGSFSP
jgi:hypothetical protein